MVMGCWLFKTRVKAQLDCKNGKISIGGKICKPSKRVSAKIAVELYEENMHILNN